MGNQGRGRGHSSSRGRGQNRPSNRIRKSSSPAAKPPAIVITSALDQNKLSHLYVPRSPIRTRAASGKAKQQSATASGKPQQPTEDGGAGPSKAATTDTTTTTTVTIPTSNEFNMLTDSEDDDKNSSLRESNNPVEKAKQAKLLKCSLPKVRDRPPMIHVVDTLCSTVDDLLLPTNVEYFVKVTKAAVQVLAVDQRNYDLVLNIFKANGVKFFTYDNRNEKLTKIVLQGLGEMSIPEVTAELQDYDIVPRDVKVLSKKTTATGTHVLYLLYFEKGSAKLQDLRQVKCLSGYIVSWRFFTKRPTDTAQCHRCQKFGHGSRNCNLTPKCVKCGKDHLTDGCSLPRKANLQNDGVADRNKPSIKCANCGGNDTANFRGCTARKTYVEQLEKRKSRPSSSSKAQPMAGTSSANPPGWGRTYANVAASGQDAAPAPNVAADGDLFSLSEFLILARDMFNRLSSCRNKQQQFMALSELMIKYVCIV